MSGRGKGKTGKKAVSRSAKAGLQFPVGRIARYLKAGKYATRVGAGAPVPRGRPRVPRRRGPELAGNASRDNKKTRIVPATSSWPSATMRSLLLGTVTIAQVSSNIHSVLLPKQSGK